MYRECIVYRKNVMEDNEMTKVDIISGFLGAGKTTLIAKLLKEAFPGEQVVLIENEFGEIGIDGGFLKESGVEIRSIIQTELLLSHQVLASFQM